MHALVGSLREAARRSWVGAPESIEGTLPRGQGGAPLLLPAQPTFLPMSTDSSAGGGALLRGASDSSIQASGSSGGAAPLLHSVHGQRLRPQRSAPEMAAQALVCAGATNAAQLKREAQQAVVDAAALPASCLDMTSDVVTMQPLGFFLLRGLDGAKLIHQATPPTLQVCGRAGQPPQA